MACLCVALALIMTMSSFPVGAIDLPAQGDNALTDMNSSKDQEVATEETDTVSQTELTSANQAEVFSEGSNNLLAGLKYTTSLRDGDANAGTGDFHGAHPDKDRVKLTDGVLVPADSSDWQANQNVGLHSLMADGLSDRRIDITFEWDTAKPLQQVSFVGFQLPSDWVFAPIAVAVEYKNEVGQWVSIFDGSVSVFSAKRQDYTCLVPNNETVQAKGVRLYVTPGNKGNGWLFTDEIEALSVADGRPATINPEVSFPAFSKNLPVKKEMDVDQPLTLAVEASILDNGVLTYEWYKNDEPLGVSTKELTFSSLKPKDTGVYKVIATNTKNGKTQIAESVNCYLKVTDAYLVSVGKPYTVFPAAKTVNNYPDTGMVELTDGKLG
ncbi:MAG: immunoglobulin domain-containing protein, partial [Oscillospiraceae bacterium]